MLRDRHDHGHQHEDEDEHGDETEVPESHASHHHEHEHDHQDGMDSNHSSEEEHIVNSASSSSISTSITNTSAAAPSALTEAEHPHGHGGHVHHGSHFKPAEYLDEAKLLRDHGPPPLSWLYYDWVLTDEERQTFIRTGLSPYGNATTEMSTLSADELEEWQNNERNGDSESPVMGGDGASHKHLIIAHIALMSLAFFGALPIVLALKAAKYKGFMVVAGKTTYWASLALGWVSGWLYKEMSPDLYRGEKHGFSTNLLLLAAIAISALDLITFYRRVRAFSRLPVKDLHSFKNIVVYGFDAEGEVSTDPNDRYISLSAEAMEMEDLPEEETAASHYRNQHRSSGSISTAPWATRTVQDHSGRGSNASETSTLHGSPNNGSEDEIDKLASVPLPLQPETVPQQLSNRNYSSRPRATGLAKFFKYSRHFWERALVPWAFIEFCWGIVVYTGMARHWFLPSLLAHFIKGSIFFWYGILTFSRFLGAWAEYGWAWNRRPVHNANSIVPSAEMIECFVIWLYGATNTWMERIGAAPGSPYTVKQVQHISIAVMFGGAGLIGMCLESVTIRSLLSSTIFSKSRTHEGHIREPRSYSASFNPFPAVVIGVLGIAMSAHKQDYEFQVTVHALWGYLLAGFGLFRLLTYFFLFLAPTTDSVLPARPPTEVLAALMLSCGGVVFVLSDEEVTFAAMRHGWDDIMAFLNVTFALVCTLFAWILIVMTVKGWAVRRSIASSSTSTRMQVGGHSENPNNNYRGVYFDASGIDA